MAFVAVGAVQVGSAQTKSQWDGVYTAEQATRGKANPARVNEVLRRALEAEPEKAR